MEKIIIFGTRAASVCLVVVGLGAGALLFLALLFSLVTFWVSRPKTIDPRKSREFVKEHASYGLSRSANLEYSKLYGESFGIWSACIVYELDDTGIEHLEQRFAEDRLAKARPVKHGCAQYHKQSDAQEESTSERIGSVSSSSSFTNVYLDTGKSMAVFELYVIDK